MSEDIYLHDCGSPSGKRWMFNAFLERQAPSPPTSCDGDVTISDNGDMFPYFAWYGALRGLGPRRDRSLTAPARPGAGSVRPACLLGAPRSPAM